MSSGGVSYSRHEHKAMLKSKQLASCKRTKRKHTDSDFSEAGCFGTEAYCGCWDHIVVCERRGRRLVLYSSDACTHRIYTSSHSHIEVVYSRGAGAAQAHNRRQATKLANAIGIALHQALSSLWRRYAQAQLPTDID